MIILLDGLYFANYNSAGQLDSVNDKRTGATAWVPNHPDYGVDNPRSVEFLQQMEAAGEDLPLYRADQVRADEF